MMALNRINTLLVMALVALAILLPSSARAQPAQDGTNIAAELMADGPAVAGREMTLAIHFTPGDGWHGYWKNPGDAGYGMQLEWDLPGGWTAGEPQYPVPTQLLIGGLMNHVYKGPYAVLIPVTVPEGALSGQKGSISVNAQWLACTDVICVPEQATLVTSLPAVADDSLTKLFSTWRAAIPAMLDSEATFAITGERLRLAIPLPAALGLENPHVYIANADLVGYAGAQSFARKGDLLLADIPLALYGDAPERIEGILAFGKGDGVKFTADVGTVPAGGERLIVSGADMPSLWVLLFGALAGGLLLNIMPCVFPILSLKALSLARAGGSQSEARSEGLAYSAGVILACVALGGLLLALRAAGEQVGWAFQLQEPGVVVALLVLAMAITANLAGVFALPSLSVTRSGEPASAFATGLLAAIVATPCTGPFMAAALGGALLLPTAQALILFAALGLGLALPFLLIGFVPALRKMLPKPGAWMETFRRFMAVPMGLTALALMWLCWRLGGWFFAFLAVLFGLVAIIAFILAERRRNEGKASAWGLAGRLAILAILGAVVIPRSLVSLNAERIDSVHDVQAFSAEALAAVRAEGKPVFLWFTADWCVTCKVNEGVAIEREATRAAFEQADVTAMRGDWTRPDPAITAFLTEQGVAGIPLYIWYAPGQEGQRLGQVLTPDELVTLAQPLKVQPPAEPLPDTGQSVDGAAGSQ